jgi:hypothetical protein
MGMIIEVVSPTKEILHDAGTSRVITVVRGNTTPISTTTGKAVVDVVKPGGTVVNVQWGYELPANPYEGQAFLVVTQ